MAPSGLTEAIQIRMVQLLLFALKNVLRQRRRSLLAVSSVAFGIMSLILANGFIQWNLRYGRESTIHSQLGHVRVFRPGFLERGQANPYDFLIVRDASVIAQIGSLDHVIAVAPRLSLNGLVSFGDSTLSFIGEGIDPATEPILSRSMTITQGTPLAPDETKGLLLGQGLAANLGAKPGDSVVLLVNTPTGGVNAVETRVVGLFATITKAYDDSALRVPISLAMELLRVSGAHSYALVLDDTSATDEVLATLQTRFQGQRLEFVPWYEMADFYKKTAALFSRQVGVIRLIIAIIIVLSITNVMMMTVMHRTSEIGTAMAMGYRRRDILLSFLAEGTVLGLLGGLVGLLFGSLMAILISAIGIPMPPPPGMAFGYTAGIALSVQTDAEALALAGLSTLVASSYPAWKASRMQIVDALRALR